MGRILRMAGQEAGPATIAGLALWLDATDISTLTFNSTTISQWRDKSGNGNHASQGTAANQPKYQATGINGKPALQGRHDGINGSQLVISDATSLKYSRFTVFSVIKRVSDLGANEILAAKYTSSGTLREFITSVGSTDRPTLTVSADGASGTNATAVVTTDTSNAFIHEALFDGTNQIVRHNGTTSASVAQTGVNNNSGNYTLFSRDAMVDPLAASVGEHLFYTRALTAGERLSILQYLSAKWGVAIG